MFKSVKVIKENSSGLNEIFKDTNTGKTMTRGEFVKSIESGKYIDYHVVHKQEGNKVISIPRSNPDKS